MAKTQATNQAEGRVISIEEALLLVREHARPLAPRAAALPEALGLRLAEAVISAVDSPPFDKSLVDGYAIDVHDRSPLRRVIEQVVAGGVPHHAVSPGLAIRVMTGAPLPEGADAVVKLEDCQLDGEQVQLPSGPIAAGTGVMRRGESFFRGQEILLPGDTFRPLDVALLAEIGRAKVSAVPKPRVAILPTGNELVNYDQRVGPGQIRNSNGPMLSAVLLAAGLHAVELGIGRDDRDDLRARITTGLDADVLLITGGVSAGVMDLVPSVLAEIGVQQVFHKVSVKPGKPVWFGASKADAGSATLVYGLPGNPVSAMVAFTLFVAPALRALAGEEFLPPQTYRGVLSAPTSHRGKRPTYHPSLASNVLTSVGKLPQVEPLPWRGSADLRALTRANALALLPEGDYELPIGAEIDVLPL